MIFDERTTLGDSHNGGKSVELVSNNTTQYIHKPHSAAIEHALEAFLLGLKQEGFAFPPKCEKILEDGDCWHNAEIVRHLPAESTDDVTLYCRRCGALIFFSYLFGSNDFHSENIIACKDSPVLVDVETLLCGTLAGRNESSRSGISLATSVLKSHLLPNWILLNGKPCDCGGLTGSFSGARNILVYNGENIDISVFESDVTEGFNEAYLFTMSHKDLVSDLIGLFSQCEFRQLLRPTETYARIISLVEKIDKEKKEPFAEALLRRAYENDVDPDRLNKVYKAYRSEVESVLRGDIPYFFVSGCSADLCDKDGVVIEGFFSLSPVESVRKRLGTLNHSDNEEQQRIISQSLSSVRLLEKRKLNIVSDKNLYDIIVDTLEERSLKSLTSQWMMTDLSSDGNLCLQSVGLGLYDGLSGILCCYAALYNKTGSGEVLSKLLSHYEIYRKFILNQKITVSNQSDCSLQRGFAGQLSSLLHIYELTGNTLFFNDAVEIFSNIAFDFSEITDASDLLCGLTGMALCLPRLPKDLAQKIASALLPKVIQTEPTLTGAAHGAAGIALAVSALQSVLGTTSYDSKIISLLEFENSFYDDDAQNWRDLRYREKNGYMSGWCSGAPGIGMTRKRISEYTDNKQILEICSNDIIRVTDKLLKGELSKRDCLCCGNASKLMAGSYLGIELPNIHDYLEKNLKCDIINLYHPIDTCDINSGLMQGFAGIGYALALYGNKISGGMLL